MYVYKENNYSISTLDLNYGTLKAMPMPLCKSHVITLHECAPTFCSSYEYLSQNKY